MKLLIEQITDISTIYESEGDKKNLFIEGIFLQGDIKNRNGRVYPKQILEKEVARYMTESVARKNSFGELNHPQGPTINLDKVSHLITSLREDGSNFIGKAKILETPMGLIARSIMEGGGQLAVSSRGLGTLKRKGNVMEVQEDFKLATAADLVAQPSAPQAYVDYIMEAPDWVWNTAKNEWELSEVINELHNTKIKTLSEEDFLKKWNKFVHAIIG